MNRSALGRYLTTPKYAAFKKAVLGADFDSARTPEGIEVIANATFTMVQHAGHPTFLDWQEEYDLVMHLVDDLVMHLRVTENTNTTCANSFEMMAVTNLNVMH